MMIDRVIGKCCTVLTSLLQPLKYAEKHCLNQALCNLLQETSITVIGFLKNSPKPRTRFKTVVIIAYVVRFEFWNAFHWKLGSVLDSPRAVLYIRYVKDVLALLPKKCDSKNISQNIQLFNHSTLKGFKSRNFLQFAAEMIY